VKSKQKLDEIDVVFDPTPLTEIEKQRISEFIRQDKSRRKKSNRKNLAA